LIALTFILSACTPAAAPAVEAPALVEETSAPAASSGAYTPPEGAMAPVPLDEGSQSTKPVASKPGAKARIAYMPPATEFNYYMAIGEGIKAKAAELGVETFMLAPESGADIAGQMKMIQDVMVQGVDAIILSTHDEKAAAPLVQQAVDAGIAVVLVNSDIKSFPTGVNGVVGYGQRNGTYALGKYIAEKVGGKANVGVLEGQPGWHSTERIGGFLDAFKEYPDMKIITSAPTAWNVETGNKVMMDMMQAHPEIDLVVAANDYIAIGAAQALKSLGRTDVLLYGNDGDTTGLEQIYAGDWEGTVNTTPFVMGKIVLEVTMDVLNGKFPGGWVETPTVNTDKDNALGFLCHPENLYPKPAQEYACDQAAAPAYTVPEGAMAPVPLDEGSQSTKPVAFKPGAKARIAYMPPATEFNYYMAIGEGIKAAAANAGVEVFMLAPESGADIAGQMKMIQDVMVQGVDAIILSTHDEKAAAPLVQQAVDAGIAVVLVNSDIKSFPTGVNGVVGYGQRNGTYALGKYIAEKVGGKANVGVLEGQPGWHSTERIGGFLDAFKEYPDMKIITSAPTAWNVETGNKVMMDMMQAHPEIDLVVAANDYIAIGAAQALKSLGRTDVLLYGNDGDTTGLEQIYAGDWEGTVNTTPFVMGKIVLEVTMDVLNGKFPGGWVETPTVNTDKDNALGFLCHPENLYPKPSKEYKCE
jgi:ribose transport system substrate-binding protein